MVKKLSRICLRPIAVWAIVALVAFAAPGHSLADGRVEDPLPQYQVDESALRTFIFPLVRGDDRFHVALIGFDRSEVLRTGLGSRFFSASHHDFGLADVKFEDFDPKYLFFISERGIHDVHTFDLGRFDLSKEPKVQVTKAGHRIVPLELQAGLPYHLFDAQRAMRSKFMYQLSYYVWQLLTLAPFGGTVVAPVRYMRIEREHRYSTTFSNLITYLSREYERPDSILRAYLSAEQLERFKVQSDSRFGKGNTLSDLFLGTDEKRLTSFRANEQVKAKMAKDKMKLVTEEAAREGLQVVPFGTNAGILAVDVSKGPLSEEIYQLVSRQDVEEAIARYRAGQASPWIGISMFVASQQAWTGQPGVDPKPLYRELVNIQRGHQQMVVQTSFNTFKLLRSIGYSIWPELVSFAFKYGERGLVLVANWSEDKIGHVAGRFQNNTAQLLRRIFSYNLTDFSEVLAAAELGAITPGQGNEGRFLSAILDYLKEDLTDEDFANLKKDFSSPDPRRVAAASRALMIQYSQALEDSQYLFKRSSAEKRKKIKKIHVHRLSLWLSDRRCPNSWRDVTCREKKATGLAKSISKLDRREEASARQRAKAHVVP